MRGIEADWEAISATMGLVTPNRSQQVVNSKFQTAYGIAERGTDRVVIANTTSSKIHIKKDCQVAEFHPRDETTYTALQWGETSEKERRIFLAGQPIFRGDMSRDTALTSGGNPEARSQVPHDSDPRERETYSNMTMRENQNIHSNTKEMGEDHNVVVNLVEPSSVANATPLKKQEGHGNSPERGFGHGNSSERGMGHGNSSERGSRDLASLGDVSISIYFQTASFKSNGEAQHHSNHSHDGAEPEDRRSRPEV